MSTSTAQLCRLYAVYHAAKTLDLGLGSSSPPLQRLLPRCNLRGRVQINVAADAAHLRRQCAVLGAQLRHTPLQCRYLRRRSLHNG